MKAVGAAIVALLIPLLCCAYSCPDDSDSCDHENTDDETSMLHLNGSHAKVRELQLEAQNDTNNPKCLWAGWRDALLAPDPATRLRHAKLHEAFGKAGQFANKVAVFYSCFKAPEALGMGNQADLATAVAKKLGTEILAGTRVGAAMNKQAYMDWFNEDLQSCDAEDWAEVSKALAYHAVDVGVELIILVAVHDTNPHKPGQCPLPSSVWCQHELQALKPNTQILPIFDKMTYESVMKKLYSVGRTMHRGIDIVHELTKDRNLHKISARQFHKLKGTSNCRQRY